MTILKDYIRNKLLLDNANKSLHELFYKKELLEEEIIRIDKQIKKHNEFIDKLLSDF